MSQFIEKLSYEKDFSKQSCNITCHVKPVSTWRRMWKKGRDLGFLRAPETLPGITSYVCGLLSIPVYAADKVLT